VDTIRLVNEKQSGGLEIGKALEAGGMTVSDLVWMHDEDRAGWILLVGTPEAKGDLRKAYRHAMGILENFPELKATLRIDDLAFVDPNDRRLRALARFHPMPAPNWDEIRWDRNAVDGTLIDDAIIYRLAA
jgi:hypothetical protein